MCSAWHMALPDWTFGLTAMYIQTWLSLMSKRECNLLNNFAFSAVLFGIATFEIKQCMISENLGTLSPLACKMSRKIFALEWDVLYLWLSKSHGSMVCCVKMVPKSLCKIF